MGEDITRNSDGFIVLRRNYSNLYEKSNYLRKDRIVINRIYEYDIRMANVSVLKWSGDYDKDRLDYLASLPKMEREVAIGKMILEDKKIQKDIKDGIRNAREVLFRKNSIQDHEVLSIKNDAVFICGRKLTENKFGSIEFKLKNQYAMFLQLHHIELYYNRKRKSADIKGVSDDVVMEPDHQKGMVHFFAKCMEFLVMDRKKELREYIMDFVRRYKSRTLPYYYYRELNRENCYRTRFELSGNSVQLTQVSDEDIQDLNIAYNYLRYILPITQLLL